MSAERNAPPPPLPDALDTSAAAAGPSFPDPVVAAWHVRANYDFAGDKAMQALPLVRGQVLTVTRTGNSDWYLCRNAAGETGYVARNYAFPYAEADAERLAATVLSTPATAATAAAADRNAGAPALPAAGLDAALERLRLTAAVASAAANSAVAADAKAPAVPALATTMLALALAGDVADAAAQARAATDAKVAVEATTLVQALYDYTSTMPQVHSTKRSELFTVTSRSGDWYTAVNSHGQALLLPVSYAQPYQSPFAGAAGAAARARAAESSAHLKPQVQHPVSGAAAAMTYAERAAAVDGGRVAWAVALYDCAASPATPQVPALTKGQAFLVTGVRGDWYTAVDAKTAVAVAIPANYVTFQFETPGPAPSAPALQPNAQPNAQPAGAGVNTTAKSAK